MSDTEAQSWPPQCRNCSADLHGHFCSACGQSHVHERLELRALAEDMLEGVINLDARVLRTIGELTVAPARVCRDFLAGRRILYINPFRYALATFAFAYLMAELLVYLHGPPADEQLAALSAFQLRWGQLLNFALMPALAGFLWALFARAPSRLRWIEHYVLVLFAFGHVALIQGLFSPFVSYLGAVGSTIHGLVPIAYLSWIGVGIYDGRGWTTVLRVIVAYVAMQLLAVGLIWWLAPELLGAG